MREAFENAPTDYNLPLKRMPSNKSMYQNTKTQIAWENFQQGAQWQAERQSCRDTPTATTPAKQQGLTLIELIITVTILAIMATAVVPTMSSIASSNETTTAANSLAHAMQITRSSAVKGNQEVSLSAGTQGFLDQWCIYTGDYDRDCSGEGLTKVGSPDADGIKIDAPTNRIVFEGNGRPKHGGTLTFTLTPEDCKEDSLQKRLIHIDQTGRAEVSRVDC